LKKLNKKLSKEKKKIKDKQDQIHIKLKHLNYLDFLYKSKKSVVFVDDIDECLGDFNF